MILDELKTDLIVAMKDKATLKVSVIRFLVAAVKNKEIELKSKSEQLTDEHVLKVLKKQIKQRNQSIEQYESAGRAEQAQQEKDELEILEEYYKRFDKSLA